MDCLIKSGELINYGINSKTSKMKTPMQKLIDQLEADKETLHTYLATIPMHSNRGTSASARIGLLHDIINQAIQLRDKEEKESYVGFGNYTRHPATATTTVGCLFEQTFKNDLDD
jgi:hypothetical protein